MKRIESYSHSANSFKMIYASTWLKQQHTNKSIKPLKSQSHSIFHNEVAKADDWRQSENVAQQKRTPAAVVEPQPRGRQAFGPAWARLETRVAPEGIGPQGPRGVRVVVPRDCGARLTRGRGQGTWTRGVVHPDAAAAIACPFFLLLAVRGLVALRCAGLGWGRLTCRCGSVVEPF